MLVDDGRTAFAGTIAENDRLSTMAGKLATDMIVIDAKIEIAQPAVRASYVWEKPQPTR